jgi:hypothetical protein
MEIQAIHAIFAHSGALLQQFMMEMLRIAGFSRGRRLDSHHLSILDAMGRQQAQRRLACALWRPQESRHENEGAMSFFIAPFAYGSAAMLFEPAFLMRRAAAALFASENCKSMPHALRKRRTRARQSPLSAFMSNHPWLAYEMSHPRNWP